MSGIGRPYNQAMLNQNLQMNMQGMSMPVINQMFGMNPAQSMMNPMFQSNRYLSHSIHLVQGMNMNPMFNPMMNPLTNPTNVMNLMKQTQQVEYKKVWVGHIPPGTSDAFILRLLESCGTVTSWKRTTDQQDRPKGFGLCEYSSVESMLKSLRLLNYLKLDEGYELSVNIIFKI